MIGVFDYTVILTYLSLLSAGTGIVVSLSGGGHPYWGTLFLLICGICDLFDGKVARTKKNRTELEKKFGIQIDSLSDLVAFGVLPACIGIAMIRRSHFLNDTLHIDDLKWYTIALKVILTAILLFYVLAALVRLAYYNVTEEERQKTDGGNRSYFIGVPVTVATFSFPLVMILRFLVPFDVTLIYIAVALFMTFAFVSKIKIPKASFRGISIMIGVGFLEIIVLVILKICLKY